MKILDNTIKYLSCNINIMSKLKLIFLFVISTLLSACFTPPNVAVSEAPAGDYILDPTHTSVIWSLKHAGLSNYTARFDQITGALVFDPDNPSNSRVDIRIVPASVSTGDSEFDKEIAFKGSYFNAEKFTEIRFVSTNIKITGENAGDIIGDLSFRGETRPLTLKAVFNGAGKSFGHKGKTLGFSATAKFRRSDFGLTHLKAFGIGDEVSIVIETEFNEK